jgi:hypothetical protein
MANEAVATPSGAMEPTRRREFALSDAMILIAGVALFLSLTSYLFAYLLESSVSLYRKSVESRSDLLAHWPIFWVRIRGSLFDSLYYIDQILGYLLGAMVLIFPVLRCRRPRPPLHVLLRQPGTAAALAVLIGVGPIIIVLDRTLYPAIDPRLSGGLACGGGVTVAWAILALSRGWQAEAGWIDRMGRWIGAAAVLHMSLGLVLYVIIPILQ